MIKKNLKQHIMFCSWEITRLWSKSDLIANVECEDTHRLLSDFCYTDRVPSVIYWVRVWALK